MERGSLSSTDDGCESRLFSCPTMLSQQTPRAELIWETSVPETVPSAGWYPTCSHKYLCQIILEDRAECATSPWLLKEPSCGDSLCRTNLCFLSEDHLPSKKHRKLISGLGIESRFAFFPHLKLPSSVILVWSIPGIRCSNFLQMQTWIWKPSFPLPTPSGRWDFPSFVKIVTYKRRKGLRVVHHVYFTWYVFALALTQAVFMPNYSSICSLTPIFLCSLCRTSGFKSVAISKHILMLLGSEYQQLSIAVNRMSGKHSCKLSS